MSNGSNASLSDILEAGFFFQRCWDSIHQLKAAFHHFLIWDTLQKCCSMGCDMIYLVFLYHSTTMKPPLPFSTTHPHDFFPSESIILGFPNSCPYDRGLHYRLKRRKHALEPLWWRFCRDFYDWKPTAEVVISCSTPQRVGLKSSQSSFPGPAGASPSLRAGADVWAHWSGAMLGYQYLPWSKLGRLPILEIYVFFSDSHYGMDDHKPFQPA